MPLLISYGIGYIGAFALFQVLANANRDDSEPTLPAIAANLTLALFWPLVFAVYVVAWCYGYVSQAVAWKKRGYPRTRRAR